MTEQAVKITGIIAEYNPFHNGHRWQVQEARRRGATHVVAVMGGDFLQRGAPALLDKRLRAEAALAGGVDLVLELPLPYACAAAQRFAFGGVALLDALGCVDALSFGSESGDLGALQSLAALLEAPALAGVLAPLLDQGMTFAAARQQAVARLAGPEAAELLRHPNNTLAVEYLVQLARLGSAMAPQTVRRRGAGHHAAAPGEGRTASATFLRTLAGRGDWQGMAPYMPEESCRLLVRAAAQGFQADSARLELPLLGKLRTMTPEDFARLPDLSEGLENRLYHAVRSETTLDGILQKAKTKRYTLARIRRILLAAWLGLEEGMNREPPPYLRVLAINSRGAQVLARAKQTAKLPLSHAPARLEEGGPRAARLVRLEAQSVDLFHLLTPRGIPCGWDYTAGLVKRL